MAERLPDEIPLAQSVNLAIPETEGVRLLVVRLDPMDLKEPAPGPVGLGGCRRQQDRRHDRSQQQEDPFGHIGHGDLNGLCRARPLAVGYLHLDDIHIVAIRVGGHLEIGRRGKI